MARHKKFKVTISVDPLHVVNVEADRVGYDACGNLVFLIDSKIAIPGKAQSAATKTIKQWVMFDETPDFDEIPNFDA